MIGNGAFSQMCSGLKISVRIDYEPMADPIREQPAALPEETALNIENALKCTLISGRKLG